MENGLLLASNLRKHEPVTSRNSRGLMGLGLTALNKAAGSPLLDTLRLRTPLQRGVFHAGRTGCRALGAATRTLTAVQRRPGPERPRTMAPPARFDLTPTDEQRMIRDLSRKFAAEQLRPAAT